MAEAHAAGQRDFGENYVQELTRKAEELAGLSDGDLGDAAHYLSHYRKAK